jgi:hypothetical protein
MTTQQYGLSAASYALRHCLFVGRRILSAGTQSTVSWAKENGHFWLTTRLSEAYIRPTGAPSAYGAIARL